MMQTRLLLIVFLLASVDLWGQINFGVRGGLNVSNIQEFGLPLASENDFFTPKASYHLGAFSKIPTTEKVFFLLEGNYSRRGSRLRDNAGNRANLNIEYLEVPLLIGIQLDDWSVIFGPQIAFNLNQSNTSTTNFDLVGGVKYYLVEKLQLELRYIQGLSSLNNLAFSDGGGFSGPGSLRNQLLQLSLSLDLLSVE